MTFPGKKKLLHSTGKTENGNGQKKQILLSVDNRFYKTQNLTFTRNISSPRALDCRLEVNGRTIAPFAGQTGLSEYFDTLLEKYRAISLYVKTPASEAIQVIVAGRGPTLLMIPGFGGSVLLWRDQIKKLSAHYRVVFVHGPECTVSIGFQNIHYQHFARIIDHIFQTLPIPLPTYVIAASYGGLASDVFVAKHQDTVKKFVLISSVCRINNRLYRLSDSKGLIERDLDYVLQQTDSGFIKDNYSSFVEKIVEGTMVNPIHVKRMIRLLKDGLSVESLLPSITIPTLVIGGKHDGIIDQSRLLHEKIPHSQLKEIEEAGHFPYVTHPEQLLELIAEFIF